MAISTTKLVAIAGTLLISVVLSFALLYSSIIPQFSVNEFYSQEDPSALLDKKIQLVGDVEPNSTTISQFRITDWEGKNYSVTVNYDNVPLPGGFTDGKRVMVEGMLKHSGSDYYIEASLISTKCPTKYQSN